jgi:hypothetical protein
VDDEGHHREDVRVERSAVLDRLSDFWKSSKLYLEVHAVQPLVKTGIDKVVIPRIREYMRKNNRTSIDVCSYS